MDIDRPHRLTVRDATQALRARQISAVELITDVLSRIQETEPAIHAYALVTADRALESARKADEMLRRGSDLPPLIGIPVGIKDVIETAAIPTECGSRVRTGFVPSVSAEVVVRLEAAGAIVIGKTVTHEFAFGVLSPPTRCPWDLTCIPGGSSGGSGAAVAADSCLFAVGTDTGCSVRNPASINGVVGLKPTFGRVSRFGVIPVSWSLDHVGPLTKTAGDAGLVLEAMASYDPRDASSLTEHAPRLSTEAGLRRKAPRVGIPTNYFFDGVAEDVKAAVRRAIAVLQSQGADVIEVTLTDMELALPAVAILSMVESSTFHSAQLRRTPTLYEPDSRARLEAGELITGTAYVDAQRARTRVKESLRKVFETNNLDVLATPTCPLTALPIGQPNIVCGDGSVVPIVNEYARLPCPFNLSGQPAISIPCGFDSQQHPVGLQIIGRPFDEAGIISLAQLYESATDWHTMKAPL